MRPLSRSPRRAAGRPVPLSWLARSSSSARAVAVLAMRVTRASPTTVATGVAEAGVSSSYRQEHATINSA